MAGNDNKTKELPILKTVQLIFGVICYVLLYQFHTSILSALVVIASNGGGYFVLDTFVITAIVGYPFVIIISTIIAVQAAAKSQVTNVLCFLLDIIGFGMYLATGIMLANFCVRNPSADVSVRAMAAMCILTGLLFLFEIIGTLLKSNSAESGLKKIKKYSIRF